MTKESAIEAAGPTVVDASVVVEYLVELTHTEAATRVFRGLIDAPGRVLWAPDLIYSECTSALRKLVALKRITRAHARERIGQLVRLPLAIARSQALIADAFELTEALTAYDAVYAALARRLGAPLITADAKLGRALRTRHHAVILLSEM